MTINNLLQKLKIAKAAADDLAKALAELKLLCDDFKKNV